MQTTDTDGSPNIRPYGLVSVIGFVSGFIIACKNNAVHEGTAMWLMLYFLKRTAAAALKARLLLKLKSSTMKRKEGVWATYSHIVNQMLKTYATNDLAVEADNDILRLTQPDNTIPLQFPNAALMKTLRVSSVYDEYVLKETFIVASTTSI